MLLCLVVYLQTTEIIQQVSARVDCPILSCTDTIGGDYCFKHSGDSPVTSILSFKCPANQWCYLQDGQYAWVRAQNQVVKSLDQNNKNNSQVFYRYTEKHCEDISTFKQQLQNGRSCDVSAQCLSNTCDSVQKRCVGKSVNESCSSHEECNVRYACNPSKEFPFETTCKEMFTSGICYSDNECAYTHFCWPANPNNQTTECLRMFSQPEFKTFGVIYDSNLGQLDNSLTAGKYCQSGIAVINANKTQATCVRIEKISTNINQTNNRSTTAIPSPYQCSLQNLDAEACKYWYQLSKTDPAYKTSSTDPNANFRIIANEYCDCSLDPDIDKQVLGICPYPGQDQLDTYVNSLNIVLNNTNCQTVDWLNMEAQKDCGVGSKGGDMYQAWQFAVESQFNITYWQYLQSNYTRSCLNEIMATSLLNLEKKISIQIAVNYILISIGVIMGLVGFL
eukprot:403351056